MSNAGGLFHKMVAGDIKSIPLATLNYWAFVFGRATWHVGSLLVIYLFLAVWGLRCCVGLSPVAEHRLEGSWASALKAQGLSTCGAWA